MTVPAVAASRFLSACLLGAVLGIWYDFLRPLGRKYTAVRDLIFLLGVFWIWLVHSFGICGGDLRLGYGAGLFLGGLAWEGTLGRFARPVFSRFWNLIAKIWRLCWLPLKKISIFAKFLFASAKKWVTIKCNNRHKIRRASGGKNHGRKQKSPPQCAGEIPPKQTSDQGGRHYRYRVVYGGSADHALGPDRH